MRGMIFSLLLLSGSTLAGEPFAVTHKVEVYGWNGMYLCGLKPEEARSYMTKEAERGLQEKADALCGGDAFQEMCSFHYDAACVFPGYIAEVSARFTCKETL